MYSTRTPTQANFLFLRRVGHVTFCPGLVAGVVRPSPGAWDGTPPARSRGGVRFTETIIKRVPQSLRHALRWLSRKSARCITFMSTPAFFRPASICSMQPGLVVTTIRAPVRWRFSIFRFWSRSAIAGSVRL